MDSILFEATLYLAAMVIAVPLSVRLGLGSVLGYLMAGVALGRQRDAKLTRPAF